MNDVTPRNDEAERALLGALLSGSPAIDDISDTVQGRDFYQPKHETVYDACLAVHASGNRVDPVLVKDRMGDELTRWGGAPMLFDLLESAPSVSPPQAVAYAQLVAESALSRRLVEAAASIQQQAAKPGADVQTIAQDARQAIDEAAQSAQTTGEGVAAGDLLMRTLDKIDGPQETGLATPWPDVDDVVSGLLGGQLVIVGARPSIGKSVIATNLAATAADHGAGVYFASLEMTEHEVMSRIIANAASVDIGRVMHHRLDDSDWRRISERTTKVRDWPLIVDDTAPMSFVQLRSRVRNAKRRLPNLKLVVVDYLQLMAPRDRRVPREQQVGELSESLKMLAKELDVTVVALAQVNRASGTEAPSMSDLRESGRIEADADQVWLLHRPDVYETECDRAGELDVIIAKNRNGPIRTVTLAFAGHYSRAVSMAV